MADESDDSDEWGMEELDIPAKTKEKTNTAVAVEDDDEFWNKPEPKPKEPKTAEEKPKEEAEKPKDDRPLIIVDMTKLDENINNKFDKNGCSDPEAASTLRKKIEKDYQAYAADSVLLENGTVIPCGMSVWRGALSRLRDERPGHYFLAIFPPKK